MTSKEIATAEQGEQQPAQKVVVPIVGQLTDLEQAYRYSSALALSTLLPRDLVGKPSNVLAIILYGQQLDLTPMQAIQSIYVVNGRPSMSGQLWLSKVREAGHRAFVPCQTCGDAAEAHGKNALGHRYIADHDAQRCTMTIIRGDSGEQHTETFTWDEAVAAKLTGKDVWKSYPKRMLLWRAVSNCATIICPEVALGFGSEDPDAVDPGSPTLGTVAAERTDVPAPTPEPTPEPEIVVDPEPTPDELAELAAIAEKHTTAAVQDYDPTLPDDPDLFAHEAER
jgi:hypothetical protein